MQRTGKLLDRMNRMVDDAMNGRNPETVFDESKLSALESKLNAYLNMTNAKVAQMEQEKDKIKSLISDISHQTKTPVSNLMLYSALLEEQEGLPADALEMVGFIAQQSQKLNFLIQALIQSSRLETGIISVLPVCNSTEALIRGALAQLSAQAEQKEITIGWDCADQCALFDMKWTTEAIYNLLDNAVKYTPNAGRIDIRVTPYHLFCRIDIQDNGMGIAQDELDKIYGRFYRSTRVQNIQGVGIGLFLAREIISAQNGYIKVTSKVDKGTLFSVFLPNPAVS